MLVALNYIAKILNTRKLVAAQEVATFSDVCLVSSYEFFAM